MIRGLYSAASGMIYENKRQENIAQNISNVNTTGFKQTYLTAVAQEEGLLVNSSGKNTLGTLTMKVGVGESGVQLTQGALYSTSNSLDFAIDGTGFFTVQGPEGLLYTRDGRFSIDEQGRLVSKEGYPVQVQDEKGNMQSAILAEGTTVSSKGEFFTNGGQYQFVISNLPNEQRVVKQGDSLYGYDGDVVQSVNQYTVNQYMLEGSNVDATEAMVDMIAINRSLQTNSKVLTTLDETLRSTVSEVGRV